ncbi:10682_t:CDS:2 [Diversispora eburnea]|uniref:10682_t:CDS:1 n=1 Tax=Diversispora eburnea TaxID=1213867 RepID=A0A9N8WHM8_9GLOM|nr:10682_t:CDS:2 [Diversispora eburnea]
MTSSEEKAKAKKEFEDVFPTLAEEFLTTIRSRSFPNECVEWLKKCIYHNVPGGKMNRGLSVIDTLEILKDGKVSSEELFKARVLGWCVEWLQAFFLVADDIMDASITRRGNPCWYKMKYFRQDPYYVDLLELFHEITLETEFGQLLDLVTAPEDDVDLNRFSMEKGIFPNSEVIGKIGTDIEDNKCSWCINQALLVATPEQRKLLDENYGKKNPENVSVIKEIYKQLDIEEKYKNYENESFIYLSELISQLDETFLKKEVFNSFMKKIYKRTK